MTKEQEELIAEVTAMHERCARQVAKVAFCLNTKMRAESPDLDQAAYWELACRGISRGVTNACEGRGLFDRITIKYFRLRAYAKFEDSIDALEAEWPDGVPGWATVILDVTEGPAKAALYVLRLADGAGAEFGLTGWPEYAPALADLEGWRRAGFMVRNMVAEAPQA